MLYVVEKPSEYRDFIARVGSLDVIYAIWTVNTACGNHEIMGYLPFLVLGYLGFNLNLSIKMSLDTIRSVDYYKEKTRVAIIGSIIYLIGHFIVLYSLDSDGWTHYTIFNLLNVFYGLFYIRYTWKIVDFSGFNLKYGYGIGLAVCALVTVIVCWYKNLRKMRIYEVYALLHCIYDFCLTFKYFCIEIPGPEETLLQRIKTE
ncbi:hypothetical protein CRE_20109 [Caenorhabditis remanei]|uniref:Uncharacterized protein n=1 Tax=Caenorhabditis remanei TaxID=31234 RepID=E3NP57_CAERE|nr:hypothetical protein CRE_20109 [Caenorhabditis remanei]